MTLKDFWNRPIKITPWRSVRSTTYSVLIVLGVALLAYVTCALLGVGG